MPSPSPNQRLLPAPDGPRRRTTPQFGFTRYETDYAVTLIKHYGRITHQQAPADKVTTGLTALLTRGLITVEPALPDGSLVVQWANADAEATAARHVLRYYSHATYAQSTINDRIVRSQDNRFTPAEVALVLAWHYRYTPVHALRLTRTSAVEMLVEEHTLTSTPSIRRIQQPTAGRVDATPISDEYSDTGAVLDPTTYALLVAQRAPQHPSDHPVTIDLDTLCERSTSDPQSSEPVELPLDGTFGATLPAYTQDALAYFQAPAFGTETEFRAWAGRSLIITIPCGGNKHRLLIDPHTNATTVYPATTAASARRDGEHLLTAFSDQPELGCDAATDALEMFGDQSQYRTAWGVAGDRLAATRVITRTIQYLDAGLNPRLATPFLRLGLTAAQAAVLLAQQQENPASVRSRLITWGKHHWSNGVTVADAIPVGDS